MSSTPYERRDSAGAAVTSALASSITSADVTLSLTVATGWPDGSVGAFWIVINRGGTTEEKIRVRLRSATTLTLTDPTDRGGDGTSAAAHAAGESVELCITSVDVDEANELVSQTIGAVTTKGDQLGVTGAHTFSRIPVGTDGQVWQSMSSASAGVGWGALATGSISASTMFGAGVVTGSAIGSAAVDENKLASSVAGAGLVGGAGTALSVQADEATLTVASDTVKLKDAGIAALAKFAVPTLPVYVGTSFPTAVHGQVAYRTDLERLFKYDGTNWKIIAAGPFLRYTSSSSANISSGSATDFGSWGRDEETETWSSSVTSNVTTFTVPANCGGVYRIGCGVRWAASGSGDTTSLRTIDAIISGTTYSIDQRGSIGNSAQRCAGAVDVRLAVGNTIKIQITQNSGSGLALAASFQFHELTIRWVAP